MNSIFIFIYLRIARQTVIEGIFASEDQECLHDHEPLECQGQQSHLCWQASGSHGQVAGH